MFPGLGAIAALLVAQSTAMQPETAWSQTGRPLPQREPVYAAPDRNLTLYRSCPDKLSAEAKGSVTAILPDLFVRWRDGYAKTRPSVQIHAPPPYGPPQGRLSSTLSDFIEGKLDFALLSRTLSGPDLARYRQIHGHPPIVVPIANGSWRHFGFVDAVVVIVHADNPLRAVSVQDLRAIFGAGARPDWGALGAVNWAGKPVRIYGSADWLQEDTARSATFRSRIMDGLPWREELLKTGHEGDAPGKVIGDPFGIAVTGLGHLPRGTRPLVIALSPGEPGIAPNYANVRLARYPLTRTLDLLLHRKGGGPSASAAADFARYILSREGQEIVARQGIFLPLRAGQARAALDKLGPCEAD